MKTTLKPNYISAYSSRAAIYYSPFCDDLPLSKAIEDYATIINYNTNFCAAYRALGEIFFANKEYENADICFTRAIELKPNVFSHYIRRGKNYLELQEYENAIKDFNTALDIKNNINIKHFAYVSLGETYNLLKDYNKAIEFYTKAIEAAGKSWYDLLIKYYKLRSKAYLQLGEKEKADIDLKLMKEAEKHKNKKENEEMAF